MHEREILAHIERASRDMTARFPHVRIGPGDDCAEIATDTTRSLLVTTDQVVEGVHVVRRSDLPMGDEGALANWIDLAARKAVARSISDIAAMGGTPLALVATLCAPRDTPRALLEALSDRLHAHARAFACPAVGGDIASFGRGVDAPMVLTTTVMGQPHAMGSVRRSGARAGDSVWVTGSLGGSLASGRHATFTPRVEEAQWLCDAAQRAGTRPLHAPLHAMMDLSDGLGIDADRLARASGVSIVIDADALPMHAGVASWRQAMGDGEDYELLFVADGAWALPESIDVAGRRVPLTRVGRVEAAGNAPGCRVRLSDGTLHAAADLGWQH